MAVIQASIRVQCAAEDLFEDVLEAGRTVGTVQAKSRRRLSAVVRTPMRLFRLQNAARVRVQVRPMGADKAELVLTAQDEEQRGVVSGNSGGRAINQLLHALGHRGRVRREMHKGNDDYGPAGKVVIGILAFALSAWAGYYVVNVMLHH